MFYFFYESPSVTNFSYISSPENEKIFSTSRKTLSMHYVRQIISNVSRCILWPILQCTILVWTQIWMGFLASSRREPTQSVKTILGQSCRISRCYIHKSLSHRARFLLYIWQRIFSALCQRDDTSTKPRWQSSSPIFGKNPQITFEIQGSKTAFKNTIWPRASSQVVKNSPYLTLFRINFCVHSRCETCIANFARNVEWGFFL